MQRKKIELLRSRITELRPILADRDDASGYLSLFDEFVLECELGLALQCVCDYLNEPHVPAPDAATIERLEELHSTMEMGDDCVDLLRSKSFRVGPH